MIARKDGATLLFAAVERDGKACFETYAKLDHDLTRLLVVRLLGLRTTFVGTSNTTLEPTCFLGGYFNSYSETYFGTYFGRFVAPISVAGRACHKLVVGPDEARDRHRLLLELDGVVEALPMNLLVHKR